MLCTQAGTHARTSQALVNMQHVNDRVLTETNQLFATEIGEAMVLATAPGCYVKLWFLRS